MISFENIITTVDSHIEGEALKTITGGIILRGETLQEKKKFFVENFDHIRRALTYEPRGRKGLLYAVVLPPTSGKADIGAFFMYSDGYVDHCLSGLMGVVAIAAQSGLIRSTSPEGKMIIETPLGLVSGQAEMDDGVVKSVTVRNVPAFFFKTLSVTLPEIGKVETEVVNASDFIALVKAEDLGIEINASNIRKIIKIGMGIKNELNKLTSFQHPQKTEPEELSGVRIYEEVDGPKHVRNVVIVGDGNIDRSPCGNGSCGHMAYLHAKNKLSLNEQTVHEGIAGGKFFGKLVRTAKVGKYSAVVPEITGTVHITGVSNFIIDRNDPLKYGFALPL